MGLIKIRNVSKSYGGKNIKTQALKNINLDINEGDFIAIMGPSGSGKSTLLNIIGCMDKSSSGEYYIEDRLVNNMNNKELSEIRNKTISFVFQNFALMKDYNIYDNIEVPLLHRNLSYKVRRDMVFHIMKDLGIEEQSKKKPSELSGGQQQRVAIGRAMVSGAKIVLADEPTGALDQKTGEDVMELLKDLNKKGTTVIIITHDPKVAEKCDKILKIKDGKI